MTLKEHIGDIHRGLEANRYPNEAAVSQGIVLRLLGALGWPTFDTQVVAPEYGVEGTRVDYALCHPMSTPQVFVEVKQVGNIEGAETQLFQYAFHEGIPIAILTDGRKWKFFHPVGQGDYKDRKVYEFDLIENSDEKIVNRLNTYLDYASIQTGEAVEAIKKDYEEVLQRRQVAARLPEAWNKLVEEANEFLLDVLAEETENLCEGYRPTNEQVLDFLKSLKKETKPDRREVPSPSVPSVPPTQRRTRRTQKAPQTRLVVTMSNEEVIEHHTAMDTFREVIFKLGPEEVLRVDTERQLISTESMPVRRTSQYGQYHITENHGTRIKKTLLDRIAERLGVRLKVEIVDK